MMSLQQHTRRMGRTASARLPARAPVQPCQVVARVTTSKAQTTKGAKPQTGKGTVTKTQPQQPKTQKGVKTVSNRELRQAARKAAQQEAADKPKSNGSRFYLNLTGFPFPLGPTFERKTVRREVEKGSVWVFEQTQALELFNVYTPVRMTVIKLASGGLWVHAPVAPTEECIRLLKELDAPVEYIVLPTGAYEHKVFVGPFSRKFPKAQVWIAPYQWSFPLNLPPQFFGIFPTGTLVSDDANVPWADEIEQKVLLPPSIGVGEYVRFCEVAFFHKKSRTLMVTDSVIYVPDDPPECIPTDALLDVARDGLLARSISGGRSAEEVRAIAQQGPVEDTPENRRKGWRRMALLVLYFGPGNLLTPEDSFAAISNRLFCGPVVETLVYSKFPKTVVDWVDDICASWNFKQVIPCHFAAPVRAGPAEFRRAFTFAYELAEQDGLLPPKPAEPEKPKGLFAGLLASLGSAVAAAGIAPPASETLSGDRPTGPRPVVFPESDMKILNTLNRSLLEAGVVKRNADLDLVVAAGAGAAAAAVGAVGAVAAGAETEAEAEAQAEVVEEKVAAKA